jgi:type III restriction enzyme
VVKRFGEAIFPALRHVESVLRGGDAPHHTLIEADNGQTAPGYPDFVVFRKEGNHLVVDLLEPHDTGLADSLAKAKGLCKFAEEHGDKFGRIEWIKIAGSQIKRLNLNSQHVRECVLATNVDGALDTLFNTLGTAENMPAV